MNNGSTIPFELLPLFLRDILCFIVPKNDDLLLLNIVEVRPLALNGLGNSLE